MLSEVVTIPNEREKQPGIPGDEIAPPGSPNLAARAKLFFSHCIGMVYIVAESVTLES